MTARDSIRNAVARNPVERIPLVDFSFWPDTIQRWEKEGLPPGADVREYFGLDRIFIWDTDESPRFEQKIVEEDAESTTVSDRYGCLIRRWKNSYATPMHVRYAIEQVSAAAPYMRRYDGLPFDLVSDDMVTAYRNAVDRGDFIAVTPLEPAQFIINTLLGYEQGLLAFLEHPEQVSAAMRHLMDYSLSHIRWLIESRGIRFDALWFSVGSLCYKNGMLLSPSTYQELIQPIHREYKQFCDEHGMFLMLHCDGDVREFMPLVIESGFDAIHPLEARAGNDVRELKALYGDRITFWGNINADVIANGTRDDIREEVISKVSAAKRGGGYIYQIDHSVPPTVSFDNYSLLVKTLREFTDESPSSSCTGHT